jgi:hypothetical protein
MAGPLGWSFWRDREVAPRRDDGLPPELVGAENSSKLARFIGSIANYSPAKIDYLIQGWLGGGARDAVNTLVDPVLGTVGLGGVDRGRPAEWVDYPVIRGLLQRAGRGDHEAITRFYDDLEELAAVRKASTRLADSSYDEEHAAELYLYRQYLRTQRRMSQRWQDMRDLYQDRELDGAVLDNRVQALYDELIEEARVTLQEARHELLER